MQSCFVPVCRHLITLNESTQIQRIIIVLTPSFPTLEHVIVNNKQGDNVHFVTTFIKRCTIKLKAHRFSTPLLSVDISN